MKVKMLSIMAGPNGSFQPKDVVDFPNAVAKDLIAGGYAMAVPAATKATKKAVQVQAAESLEDVEQEDLEEDDERNEKR